MDISEESVLEIWEIFSEHVPAGKRNDLAVRFLKLIVDQDIDLADLDIIRGEDEYLDYAFEQLLEDEADDVLEYGDEYED